MIESILNNFNIKGKYISASVYGKGIINETFLVKFINNNIEEKYILRKINKFVFKNPLIVIDNTVKTIEHITKKLLAQNIKDISKYVLQLIKTKDDKYYFLDQNNNFWSVLLFIENTYTIETVKTKEQAYQAAKAFGKFQRFLLDADINNFKPTITNFHNLKNRLLLFEKAIQDDLVNRVRTTEHEISAIKYFQYLQNEFIEFTRSEKIPIRITHNDAKINNVLMNKDTNEGQCVIDLDTVMPGKIMCDFGDMVRTFTNSVREDYQDLNKVSMRIKIFENLAKGYLEELGKELSKIETKTLVLGALLITYEQAVRYLTDYLNGDKYYSIKFNNHNLIRTRTQLKLLESIVEQRMTMEKIIKSIMRKNN